MPALNGRTRRLIRGRTHAHEASSVTGPRTKIRGTTGSPQRLSSLESRRNVSLRGQDDRLPSAAEAAGRNGPPCSKPATTAK